MTDLQTHDDIASATAPAEPEPCPSPGTPLWWWLTAGTMVLGGWTVRLIPLLRNRPLGMDELFWAQWARGGDSITQSLAPTNTPLYRLAGYGAIGLLGDQAWAYRLIPLIFSCVALVAMVDLARRVLDRRAALAGILMAAFAPTAVAFACEYRHYAVESAFTILLLWAAVRQIDRPSRGTLIWLLAIGLLGPWWCHTPIIVMASVGLVLAIHTAGQRQWRRLGYLAAIGGLWLANFAGHYYWWIAEAAGNANLQHYWHKVLPRVQTVTDLLWPVQRLCHIVDFNIGLHWSLNLPLGLLAVGLCLLGGYRLSRRHRPAAWMMLSVLILAVAACGWHVYPLHNRLTVFLGPIVFLSLAGGLLITGQFTDTRLKWLANLLSVLFLALILWQGLNFIKRDGAASQDETLKLWDARSLVRQIAAQSSDQDIIFVHPYFYDPLVYYLQQADAGPRRIIMLHRTEGIRWAKEIDQHLQAIGSQTPCWLIMPDTPPRKMQYSTLFEHMIDPKTVDRTLKVKHITAYRFGATPQATTTSRPHTAPAP